MFKLLIILIAYTFLFHNIQCFVVNGTRINHEESGGHFEGDILEEPSNDGLIAANKKWINATVPYVFEEGYPESARKQFKRAFKSFETYTCVRFRLRTNLDEDYLIIRNNILRPQCASYIGKIGGPQSIILSTDGCTRVGTIIHEFMHALGIVHEQSRKDRDVYIKILWDNIPKGEQHNFKISRHETSAYGTIYNPKSLMHYQFDAFAKRAGLKTIEPQDPSIKWNHVGQRTNFATSDILQINRMYDCPTNHKLDFELNEEIY